MYERTQLWNPKHDIVNTVLHFVVSKYYFHTRDKTRTITRNDKIPSTPPATQKLFCKGHNSPDQKPFHMKTYLGNLMLLMQPNNFRSVKIVKLVSVQELF